MIWLIGSGTMSQDYFKILADLKKEFIVIGRGESSAKEFEFKTGGKVIRGGLKEFLKSSPKLPASVIVSTNVETLYEITKLLLEYGVKHILLEKPGFLKLGEGQEIASIAKSTGAKVLIAYNRRFYSSVLEASRIIKEDGGVTSFNFEFTEWSHVIEKLNKADETFKSWLLANSSHVIDLAFYLGGLPKQMVSFSHGKGNLNWHSEASCFAGAGRTESGVLFNYQANWLAPGRWSLEFLTRKHRLKFCPMEELQIQDIGSVAWRKAEIDDKLDKDFKPGLMKQVTSFLDNEVKDFNDINNQVDHFHLYNQILRGGSFEL